MKKGMLIYDSSTNRFDVLYEEGNSYGEYGNDWYLVGVQKESLPGLQVRI